MKPDFQELLKQIQSYNPEGDLELVKKAYQFVSKAHAGQKRLSGDDFITHPLAVAQILADWQLDCGSIAAGLLHDTMEDALVKKETLVKNFGPAIADLVDGVTKIGQLKLKGSQEEFFVENLRKTIVVMAHDLRVVLIKLADREHNLKTLRYLPPEKQKRIAQSTLEIYAPLAERLGLGEMKGELEDLAFPYVFPQEYHWLRKLTQPYYQETELIIQKALSQIKKNLRTSKIKARVQGRAKHFYSLWIKLLRPEINRDMRKIYDLMALRVIVCSIQDCYAALGVVHKIWRPVPSVGIRDFIAQPKPNGYRSIHTTVFGPEGKILEVQIRTEEMHEEAENGIAAHWYLAQLKNKKGLSSLAIDKGEFFAPDKKLAWVKQLVAWQKEMIDSQEFLEALKFDALAHRIFVFSPKGDVFDLPAGATPVDFAYAVHTQIGDSCLGARVDGRLVSLNWKLKSGQIVEILTSKNPKGPSRDWLRFVVTTLARREIEKYFRKG
jgi:GTP pyrophosphokinase